MEKKMETAIVFGGYIGIMGKKMETTIVYWGHVGVMEKKMETIIVYWDHIGIMEKKMETTVVLFRVQGLRVGDLSAGVWQGIIIPSAPRLIEKIATPIG